MTPLDLQTSKKRLAWGALQGIDSGHQQLTKRSEALIDGRGHLELAMRRYDDGVALCLAPYGRRSAADHGLFEDRFERRVLNLRSVTLAHNQPSGRAQVLEASEPPNVLKALSAQPGRAILSLFTCPGSGE